MDTEAVFAAKVKDMERMLMICWEAASQAGMGFISETMKDAAELLAQMMSIAEGLQKENEELRMETPSEDVIETLRERIARQEKEIKRLKRYEKAVDQILISNSLETRTPDSELGL